MSSGEEYEKIASRKNAPAFATTSGVYPPRPKGRHLASVAAAAADDVCS
jgi:hypothetical protein